MFVLLAYMVVMFLAMNQMDNEKNLEHLLKALFISASIIGFIGLLQFFKNDPIRAKFFMNLITPAKYRGRGIEFPLPEGEVYSTLAHSNYVGSYMAMLFPLSLVMFLTTSERKKKILFGLISLLMFTILLGSHSRAGLVGTMFGVLLAVIFLRKLIFKRNVYIIGAFVALAIILVGVDVVGSGVVRNYVKSLYNDAVALLTKTEKISNALKNISIDENNIDVEFGDKQLKVTLEDNKLLFKDENNKDIEITADGNVIILKDERFSNIRFELAASNNVKILQMYINNSKMVFAIVSDGFKFVTHMGEVIDLRPIEKWGFADKEALGSARGYIWSRSLPLLKNTILLGYGPDTFPLNFPQDDYIGKFINYGQINMFVDKPHNLFLNIAFNSGILSLLAILGIFALYIFNSFKVYLKCDFDTYYSNVGLAIFTAFWGYIMSGMFNDSVVPVAPVFWILLGTGISVNMILANIMEDKKVDKVSA